MSRLHECPSCLNKFVQPFVCITCGAEKLYDVTLASVQKKLDVAVMLLAECRGDVAEISAQQTKPGRIKYYEGLLRQLDVVIGE